MTDHASFPVPPPLPRWWLLVEGKPSGPIDYPDMISRLESGHVSPSALVSLEGGQQWRPLPQWPEFAETVSRLGGPSAVKANRIAPASKAALLAGGIAVGIAGIGAVAGLLSLISSAKVSDSSSQGGQQRPGMVATQQQIGQATLNSWNAIGAILDRSVAQHDSSPASVVARFRQSAAQIDALPKSNVDPGTVQCAAHLAAAFRTVADIIERSKHSGALAESFVRGPMMPAGTVPDEGEYSQSLNTVSQEFSTVQEKLSATGTDLSSRYGLEFPPLWNLGALSLNGSWCLLGEAGALHEKGDYEGAIAILTQVIRRFPESPIAYHHRGFAMELLGRCDQAMADYNQVTRLAPADPLPYVQLGGLHLAAKRWSEALAAYSKVIELDPANVGAHERRSTAYMWLGKEEDANRDRAKAEELRKQAGYPEPAPTGTKLPGPNPFAPPAFPAKPPSGANRSAEPKVPNKPPSADPSGVSSPPLAPGKAKPPAVQDRFEAIPPSSERSKAKK